MGTSGSLSWQPQQGLMLLIGKRHEEYFTKRRVVSAERTVLYITERSAYIHIEALHDSVSRLSTFDTMAKNMHACCSLGTTEAKKQL